MGASLKGTETVLWYGALDKQIKLSEYYFLIPHGGILEETLCAIVSAIGQS